MESRYLYFDEYMLTNYKVYIRFLNREYDKYKQLELNKRYDSSAAKIQDSILRRSGSGKIFDHKPFYL